MENVEVDIQQELRLKLAQGIRNDGRKMTESRQIKLTPMKKLNATKSVFIEVDKTKIICSLYGPNIGFSNKVDGEIKVQIEDIEDIKQKTRQDEKSTIMRKWESDLMSILSNVIILTEYPKSAFEISLEIVSSDGSVFCHLANSCFLVLSLAQVKLYDQISATSVTILGEKLILDPTREEENLTRSKVALVSKRNTKKLPYFNTQGPLTMNDIEKVLSLCLHGCNDLSKLMEEIILKQLSA